MAGPKWACEAKRLAQQNRQARYIGSPCPYGHSGLRYTAKSTCVECARIDQAKRNKRSSRIEYMRLFYRQRNKDRRQNDLQFKLKHVLRERLRKAVINKQHSAIDDLGCSMEFLIEYIEGNFEPGMSWDNYGHYGDNVWNIDHRVPLSKFDLTDKEQFLKAAHYTNLQPMWSQDNNRKRAKELTKEDEKRQKELRIIAQFWKEQEEQHPIRQAFARMKKALDTRT